LIRHLLNRVVEVWRPTIVGDGSGGQIVTFAQVGELPAKIDQPTAEEREEGAQWGAQLTHIARMMPGADVRRGDELRGDGQVYRVLAVVTNSRNTYTRALCERTQPEGAATP